MSRRLPHTKKIVPQIIIRIYVALGLLSLFDIKIVLYLHFHAIVFDQKFPVKRRLFTPHVFAKAGLERRSLSGRVLVKRLHLQVNDIMGVDIETLAVG